MEVKSETIAMAKNGAHRPPAEAKESLLGATLPELERVLLSLGEKPYRGRQVAEWIYVRGAADFGAMTNLPQALRARLAEEFVLGTLTEQARREPPDRRTRKGLSRPGETAPARNEPGHQHQPQPTRDRRRRERAARQRNHA